MPAKAFYTFKIKNKTLIEKKNQCHYGKAKFINHIPLQISIKTFIPIKVFKISNSGFALE